MIKDYQKLMLEHIRLLGEFKGTLEAIILFNVPNELKENLKRKIKELESKTLDLKNKK